MPFQFTPEQLKHIRKDVHKLFRVAKALRMSDTAFVDLFTIIEVALGNVAHDATHCTNYSLEREIQCVHTTIDVLKAIKDYENNQYGNYFYDQYSMIVDGISMAAMEEIVEESLK